MPSVRERPYVHLSLGSQVQLVTDTWRKSPERTFVSSDCLITEVIDITCRLVSPEGTCVSELIGVISHPESSIKGRLVPWEFLLSSHHVFMSL